jgi:hypothetical protein
LKELPEAIKTMRKSRYIVQKISDHKLNGRNAYRVTHPDGDWIMVTDYTLLEWASA